MFFKPRKRGAADAAAAAALIAIIAGLIVMYILFIPPEEREKILEEAGEEEAEKAAEETNILLSESPKRIFSAEEREFEKAFPSVNIFVGEEGLILKRLDSLHVERALFSSEEANVSFDVSDLKNIKNALLNFYAEKSEGRLLIKLNGNAIFDRELKTGNIEPINIKDRLVDGINVLEFSVSSPGAAFWKTNEYLLTDILVTADVTRKEAQESTLNFVADASEIANLKKIRLRFVPDCKPLEVGALSVSINNYEIYSAVPDCGSAIIPIEFAPERLITGENKLRFATSRGQYLIDNIRLSSELKEIIIPVYYFELKEDDFNDVLKGKANVALYIKFTDDKERKAVDIFVNNHALRIDQTEIEYNQTINKLVEKGNNAIRIEPEEVLDIAKLEVRLES